MKRTWKALLRWIDAGDAEDQEQRDMWKDITVDQRTGRISRDIAPFLMSEKGQKLLADINQLNRENSAKRGENGGN